MLCPRPHLRTAPQRVMPAMLQRALPTLGPPSRAKRLAAQHRSRQRHVPSARARMQPGSGVVQRRATTLERWDAAIKRQAQALMVQQQQQQPGGGLPAAAAAEAQRQQPCGRAAGGGPHLPPQLLLEVAAAHGGAASDE